MRIGHNLGIVWDFISWGSSCLLPQGSLSISCITAPFPSLPQCASCPDWNLTCHPAILHPPLEAAPSSLWNREPISPALSNLEHPNSLQILSLAVEPSNSSSPFQIIVHFRQWSLDTSSLSPRLGVSTTFSVFSNLLVSGVWFGTKSTSSWAITLNLERFWKLP